jgi:hypothetical protein
MSHTVSPELTRRQLLERIAMAAATVTAAPFGALAQQPSFPSGAIIRTLLRDYRPEDLAGGATLFHEHMSLGPDFGDRFRAATAAVRAANGGPASMRSPSMTPRYRG